MNYMNNVLLFTKDKETLERQTRRVLEQMHKNDLYLKLTKCSFCKEKIKYLGMIIEEGKIAMDPSKLKGIQDWPAPTTVKQVQLFLRFGNFTGDLSTKSPKWPDPSMNSSRKTQSSNGPMKLRKVLIPSRNNSQRSPSS